MAKSFDVAVIGSGPAGYVAAIKGAQLGLNVCCIDQEKAKGGTCLRVGCIPSKALLHATDVYEDVIHHGDTFGISAKDVSLDFSRLMQFREKVVNQLTGGVQFLCKKNKVTEITGHAEFLSPNKLKVGDEEIEAKNIIIATGSAPVDLPFLSFNETRVLSSTGALSLPTCPKKMLVVGGGVIGLELGSVYKRLGAEVVVIEFMDRILPEFDKDLSSAFYKILQKEGFQFHLQAKVVDGKETDQGVELQVETVNGIQSFTGDCVLVSIGRRPYTQNLQIEKAGIQLDQKGFIPVNKNFQTSQPHIYAVGDVSGNPMLAHKGMQEGKAVMAMIAGKSIPVDTIAIPNVVYTSPELASVGFSEEELKQQNIPYVASKFPFVGNGRYQAMGGSHPCFVKSLAHKETRHLLGVHILSPNASEMIVQPALALHKKLTIDDLVTSFYPHPTLSEALDESYLGLFESFIHL